MLCEPFSALDCLSPALDCYSFFCLLEIPLLLVVCTIDEMHLRLSVKSLQIREWVACVAARLV